MDNELVIAGVFLRLFIANPSWQVRHPKQFTAELIEKVLECMERPVPDMSTITSAFVALLSNHPTVANHVYISNINHFIRVPSLGLTSEVIGEIIRKI